MTIQVSRRRFLTTAAATGTGALGAMAMPYLSRAADRPQITHGVQSGDVSADGGVVWARADRPLPWADWLLADAWREAAKDAP